MLIAKHGWRIDRAIHNYIYFAFYAPYVWVLTLVVDRIAPWLIKFKPLKPVFQMMVNRYHAKMLTDDNVSKVLELKEDISAVTDKNRGIVPFVYAFKILLQDLVRSFRKRGYITQAFFKVATGGSTGIICNCNKDSCSALRAHLVIKGSNTPSLRVIAESGYSVRHDASRCAGCGTCLNICQFGAVEYRDGKRTGYRRQDCLGCGLCAEHCPQGALELYRDSEKLVPLDLDIVREEYAT